MQVLLKELRTQRFRADAPVSRYRAVSQTSEILRDGIWYNSWALDGLITKKADIETGEDQKGM